MNNERMKRNDDVLMNEMETLALIPLGGYDSVSLKAYIAIVYFHLTNDKQSL